MIAVNSRKNLHPVQQAVEESLYLENLLNDECKCERTAEAHSNRNVVCTGKVTHRYVTCMWDILICTPYAHSIVTEDKWITLSLRRCSSCKRPASECWSIRPV